MSDYINHECSSLQHGFSFIHNTSCGESISASHIDKDLFSVFVLIDGELDYIVEGKQIHLTNNDILLVGNNELHQSIFKKDCHSEYILLMINLDFFIKNNCTDLADIVFNRTLGSNNIILAKKVKESGIFNIIERLDKYTSETPSNLTVVSSVIIELLYNLNRHVTKSQKNIHKQEKIKNIIEYINNNLTQNLSLKDISEHFYLTEQHLCRLFKQNTGFTVHKYISYKRVVLTREYYLKGMPLSVACEKAGFGDYSAFYRTYSKIMNEPPHQSLSKLFF